MSRIWSGSPVGAALDHAAVIAAMHDALHGPLTVRDTVPRGVSGLALLAALVCLPPTSSPDVDNTSPASIAAAAAGAAAGCSP
jgi:hypothetical protein